MIYFRYFTIILICINWYSHLWFIQCNPTASMVMTLAETDYCRKHGYDPQSPLCCRVIFSGTVMKVNGSEEAFAKDALFSRHPEMADWPRDHGWYFAKLNITNIWVLDYFGGVKTVTPEEYYSVQPQSQVQKNTDW
uniref:Cellular repressor of E1A stimulateds 1 n=1 Tax=Callorhinchus milii TaxID=7868 RepID=A0A4W3GCT1_CALMI